MGLAGAGLLLGIAKIGLGTFRTREVADFAMAAGRIARTGADTLGFAATFGGETWSAAAALCGMGPGGIGGVAEIGGIGGIDVSTGIEISTGIDISAGIDTATGIEICGEIGISDGTGISGDALCAINSATSSTLTAGSPIGADSRAASADMRILDAPASMGITSASGRLAERDGSGLNSSKRNSRATSSTISGGTGRTLSE